MSKEATEAELKKQYKKLALQFHPDKNRAPGASEAFKGNRATFCTVDARITKIIMWQGKSDWLFLG